MPAKRAGSFNQGKNSRRQRIAVLRHYISNDAHSVQKMFDDLILLI